MQDVALSLVRTAHTMACMSIDLLAVPDTRIDVLYFGIGISIELFIFFYSPLL